MRSVSKYLLTVLMCCFFVIGANVFASGQRQSSSSKSSSNANHTVTVWLWNSNTTNVGPFRKLIIDPFNASQSKYTAKAVLIQHGNQEMRLALSAGKGPDVVFTAGPGFLIPYAKKGLVIPLNGYAKKYHWNRLFIPSMLKLNMYKGKLYGLPDEYESMFLYYNQTVFKQHGWTPPKTLAQLEKVAAEAKKAGITPFAGGSVGWKPVDEWYVTVFLNHYAGARNVYDALTGKKSWASPVFVNAIKLLNNWWQKGWFSKNYYALSINQAVNNLATGKAAMELTGSWGISEMKNYFGKSKQQWNWVPIPALSSHASYPLYELGIGGTNSISKFSKDPNGAAAYLNYIYQPKNFLRWTASEPGTGFLFPPEKVSSSALQSVASKLGPRYLRQTKQVGDAIANGSFGYTTWTFWPHATEQYIINDVEKVWANELTPQQFMNGVEKQFKADMKAGNVPPVTAPGVKAD